MERNIGCYPHDLSWAPEMGYSQVRAEECKLDSKFACKLYTEHISVFYFCRELLCSPEAHLSEDISS